MWQLRDRIHRVIVQAFTRDPGRVVESLAEHVRIADAVIEGRADDAAAAVVEHLEIGKQRIFLPARR
jgi:DNA-binding FadR family transcriptional regulator